MSDVLFRVVGLILLVLFGSTIGHGALHAGANLVGGTILMLTGYFSYPIFQSICNSIFGKDS